MSGFGLFVFAHVAKQGLMLWHHLYMSQSLLEGLQLISAEGAHLTFLPKLHQWQANS